ncbi:hypothetical protein UFOVP112_19 [uncultured Caudovirales phage]|uniref:Uncharacterized protein n=1 Tax=uncultured Caudovirales phage TaxID=2100421 RepID=A0A6J5L3Z9_9CAUD|nr:hypothetical protein UFOVP112_19 [uncultured Caudovirales phage]
MFKNLRISILNWLAAGRLVIEKDKKPVEYNMTNTYTIGGAGNGTLSIGGLGGYGSSTPQTGQTMMIKITPANGGTIVQMHVQEYSQGELHIIPDGADFDRELGKIITMSKLKA